MAGELFGTLAHQAHVRCRRVFRLQEPASLDRRRPDGGVLLRRGSRDEGRVDPRRAVEPAPGGASGDRGARRDGRSGADLPLVESRGRGGARMGHPDGDRYRVRGGRDGVARGTDTAAAQNDAARARDGGRYRRDPGDRDFLHRRDIARSTRNFASSVDGSGWDEGDRDTQSTRLRDPERDFLDRGPRIRHPRDYRGRGARIANAK
jgi:hypothetical protein